MQSFSRSQHSKRSSSTNETNQATSAMNRISPDDDNPKSLDPGNQCNTCSGFQCSICLETARDAVVSMCGHLFCWGCLAQWLYAPDSNTQIHYTCPVCRSGISRDKTIPIYVRGSNRQHPRDELPPRPSGERNEVPNQPNQFGHGNLWAMGGPGAQIFGFGDGGFHMSFGIGSLPQYILAFMQEYTANDRRNDTDFFLMKFFFICGCLFIFFTISYL